MDEQWRPVPNFDGYEVSSGGRVRSFRRGNGLPPLLDVPRLLRPGLNSSGYPHIQVRAHPGAPVVSLRVHRLVCEVFLGPPPPDRPQVNHKDSDRTNNHISNLEYVSVQGNANHRSKHGFGLLGVKNHKAKLTPEKVQDARRRYAQGESQQAIADSLGVTQMAVSKAVRRLSWVAVE